MSIEKRIEKLEDKLKRLQAAYDRKELECAKLEVLNLKILDKWRTTDALYKEINRRYEYLKAIQTIQD